MASGSCNRTPAAPVGVSTRSVVAAPHASEGRAGESAVAGPDPLPAGYAKTYRTLTAAPFASQGHAPGRYLVTIYANDAARLAYEAGQGAYPAGAIFIAEHAAERDAEPPGGPIYMMEKREGDAGLGSWRYVAVDVQGRVARESTVALCAACHADAPRDGVFPPR